MSKRKTVLIDYEKTTKTIKKKCRNNTIFCEKMNCAMRMNRTTKWVSEWKRNSNLPSPEEAAWMCVILDVAPEEILLNPDDIELVKGLIETERAKEKAPGQEAEGVSAKKRALIDAVDDLTDEQCEKMLGFVLEAKKLL